MYRCEECGHFFEEPIEVHDDPSADGVSLPQGYYTEWYCPKCGSDQVDEAGECRSCYQPTASWRILCDDCREELADIMNELAKKMRLPLDELVDAITETYELEG